MPLVTCPDCGNRISELAHACPNCGWPALAILKTTAERNAISPKRLELTVFQFALAFLASLMLLALIAGGIRFYQNLGSEIIDTAMPTPASAPPIEEVSAKAPPPRATPNVRKNPTPRTYGRTCYLPTPPPRPTSSIPLWPDGMSPCWKLPDFSPPRYLPPGVYGALKPNGVGGEDVSELEMPMHPTLPMHYCRRR
jgi:hypothetical protein